MIYVDPAFATNPTEKWPYWTEGHVFSDDEDLTDLHTLAKRIGLKRGWFQYHPKLSHYDLTAEKRQQAIKLGALPIEGEELKRLLERKTAEKCCRFDSKGKPCGQIATHWTPSKKYAYCEVHSRCVHCGRPVEELVFFEEKIWVCICYTLAISAREAVSSTIWPEEVMS